MKRADAEKVSACFVNERAIELAATKVSPPSRADAESPDLAFATPVACASESV